MAITRICNKYKSAFNILGKKWTGLILRVLQEGPMKFTDISNLIPEMSDKMLGERFRELEIQGLITRKVYSTIPVRIEYELTDKGKGLKLALDEIQKWAETWI
ncbi:winged helix-turn-helix transcriptional regulator [Pelosinus baikalensis]|uniref:Helix-turn-helix transcriptional regulator n=1 Tax=Pelosinus baikalensis TaxID=2892015 RepID=A0ABS8HW92_9FIRM|nr:helix-turn-helix domain-containing protein [Pelosinus baikalensis]MCC5466799.1 helix-turn-helix transcriptional regulator [Pelosinus baikalensis]